MWSPWLESILSFRCTSGLHRASPNRLAEKWAQCMARFEEKVHTMSHPFCHSESCLVTECREKSHSGLHVVSPKKRTWSCKKCAQLCPGAAGPSSSLVGWARGSPPLILFTSPVFSTQDWHPFVKLCNALRSKLHRISSHIFSTALPVILQQLFSGVLFGFGSGFAFFTIASPSCPASGSCLSFYQNDAFRLFSLLQDEMFC